MNEITFVIDFKALEEFATYAFGFCFATYLMCLFAYDCLKGTVNVITKFINTVLIRFKIKKKVGTSTKSAIYDYRVEENEGNGLLYCNNEYVLACNHYENALMIKAILEDDDRSNLPFNK